MSGMVLTIDEGTSGTRAALVDIDGTVHHEHHRRLATSSPGPGRVEQDADEILNSTMDVVRSAWGEAQRSGIEVVGVAISTQRATAVLWDTHTGRPLVPAVVWQDTRHSAELAEYAPAWDAPLREVTGRPTGVRSPYLWAAHHLRETPSVQEAYRTGRLAFGTVDTWLAWQLTLEKVLVMSATNATACGGLDLRRFDHVDEWLEALGFPHELAPRLVADAGRIGTLAPEVIGATLPILATVGDQHAALVGLGCTRRGDAMVVHGTGSFVDLCLGDTWPPTASAPEGTLALTGWRIGDRSTYTLETFAATTGAALNWACAQLGWFSSPRQVSELAGTVPDSGGVTFLPSITGMRSPVMEPRARGALRGLSSATTRAHVARAVLEGVAQFVAQATEDNASTAGFAPTKVRAGGGLAASDVLLQVQADLTGVPVHRTEDAASASLRGAAYLAGTQLADWPELDELPDRTSRVFEPQLAPGSRSQMRREWRTLVDQELHLVREES